jgi:hypothetical protein
VFTLCNPFQSSVIFTYVAMCFTYKVIQLGCVTLVCEGFSRTNTLAYLSRVSVTKDKSFYTLAPAVNFIKLFPFVTDGQVEKVKRTCPCQAFLA